MLWVVRHEWPSGARFAFNCYRHWVTLVIRSEDGTGHFLLRKEGVTQGDPLVVAAYRLVILPLIRELRTAHPVVTHPWYADDVVVSGTFVGIWKNMENLMLRVPPRGYFLEFTKSILVVSPWNSLR